MKSKLKKVLDRVFKVYGQDDSFDKINYQYKRCYEIFSRETETFNRLGWLSQYEILSTSLCIAFGSSSGTLRSIVILSKREPRETEIKFSPEYGFENPEIVRLLDQKLLGTFR